MDVRILVIEDETELSENIKIFLEHKNYKVIIANDGIEGIRIAKMELPDLIICDIMMPYLDGYGVLKALSADKHTSIIPFIFLTARAERDDIRKGMNLGADDYLIKPFTIRDLLAAIDTRLKKLAAIKARISQNELSEKNRLGLNDRILFKTGNSKNFVRVEHIMYISAERQYTNIVLNNSKKILVRKALGKWEQGLPDDTFIRISRSVLLNINYIKKIIKTDDRSHTVILSVESIEFPISRRCAKNLSVFMKQN